MVRCGVPKAAGVNPLTATLKEVDESATVNATDGTMGFTGAAAHDFRTEGRAQPIIRTSSSTPPRLIFSSFIQCGQGDG